MPRVKIDYIVSFSSEDEEHKASNLLSWDVSKKKWLCRKGESSASIVLQLIKAVQIESIFIGAHHASLVEVLVGRSETPDDPYEVLVPSCVFVSARDSRSDTPVERVRNFTADQLAAAARGQRWDRVRLVCTQPYNRHCQFGLSFIHIFEPEHLEQGTSAAGSSDKRLDIKESNANPSLPKRLFNLETYSSDEDEFKPGQLFAKYQSKESDRVHINTETQIRQANSNALKNITDTTTKLAKTPISKTCNKRDDNNSPRENDKKRQRNDVLYTKDDERPHDKIDRIVKEHKDNNNIEREDINIKTRKGIDTQLKRNSNKMNDSAKTKPDHKYSIKETKHTERKSTDVNINKRDNSSERVQSDHKRAKLSSAAGVGGGSVLRGVVFSISGYQHPRRGAVRALALAMGARYRPDYTPDCTHLLCAFPNTPKLREIRSSAAGARVVAVRAEWVEDCHRQGRRLEWRPYAIERHVADDTGHSDAGSPHDDSGEDTEDEIERVQRSLEVRDERDSDVTMEARAKRKSDSGDSDVTVEERVADSDDSDVTLEETRAECRPTLRADQLLGDFLEGCTVRVSRGAPCRAELERYLRAYGALLLPEKADIEPDIVVCEARPYNTSSTHSSGTAHVRPEWVWHCHERRRRLCLDDYLV
ncbi:DNA repair protein XRCC1 isoform X2 [Leptidea sinapis]|uniref:DNA repair protein XRCC1 isoform X2 n=1 Tax=Leptidea sinapis TaxID=189913 RepID=UPI0021C36CA2|nr:DNA repair protein XRCC1 isoform X2 [Leptidea sinapis]